MDCNQEKALASAHGFEVHPDRHRGGSWSFFIKGDVHVWLCSAGWARATVRDGYFQDHTWHKTLEAALQID